jgi:hypothetical protein
MGRWGGGRGEKRRGGEKERIGVVGSTLSGGLSGGFAKSKPVVEGGGGGFAKSKPVVEGGGGGCVRKR